MNIQISPHKTFVKLLFFIFALLFFNVLGIISKFYFNHGYVYGLVSLFDFDAEKNIPTLYSTFALLFSSILLSIISLAHKRNGSAYILWLILAIIFLFLSIDEFTSIHEQLISPFRKSLNTSGLLYFAWVIPYGIALIVFVLSYLKFLVNLPKNIMILFLVSGVTFVTGAIGFELLGGRQVDLYGRNNLVYSLLYTCEEFLEMLGIVIFIYALLMYIVIQFKSLAITIYDPSIITHSNKGS